MTAEPGSKRFCIPGTCDQIKKVAAALVRHYHSLGLPDEKISSLQLALDEAVSNAVTHGHRGDCTRKVRIDCEWDASAIRLVVADQGPGFECKDLPDPTMRDNLPKETGRGLYIIASIMSDVSFNEKGNEIRMTLARQETADG